MQICFFVVCCFCFEIELGMSGMKWRASNKRSARVCQQTRKFVYINKIRVYSSLTFFKNVCIYYTVQILSSCRIRWAGSELQCLLSRISSFPLLLRGTFSLFCFKCANFVVTIICDIVQQAFSANRMFINVKRLYTSCRSACIRKIYQRNHMFF